MCNPDKQSRVRNLVYTGERVRKVRMSYLDTPDMQVRQVTTTRDGDKLLPQRRQAKRPWLESLLLVWVGSAKVSDSFTKTGRRHENMFFLFTWGSAGACLHRSSPPTSVSPLFRLSPVVKSCNLDRSHSTASKTYQSGPWVFP